MPTIYASGNPNSDGYLSGISVETPASLMANIRDALTAAGWTVDDSQIAGDRIEAVGNDNGDSCWLNFWLTNVSSNEYELHLQGDLDGSGVNVSLDYLKLPYFANSQARLYLSADSGSGCIFVQNGSGGGKSAHFGFLDRLTDSPYSWCVGLLTNMPDFSYIAKDIYEVIWSDLSRYYPGFNDYNWLNFPAQHLWDSYTVSHNMHNNFHWRDGRAGNRYNAGYKAYLGAIDAVTGLPILSDYGYLIGRNDARNDYFSSDDR